MLEDGGMAIGFCNFGTEPVDMNYADFEKLGLKGRFTVRDLWRQKQVATVDTKTSKIKLNVPAHGVLLYKFSNMQRY